MPQSRSLLALSFGIGEEILFRGLMQATIAEASTTKVRLVSKASSVCQEQHSQTVPTITVFAVQLGSIGAQALAVAVASVAFGAIHTVTPLYFVIATAVGVLHGVEFVYAGLPAAAITHWLYDWFALELQLWLSRCSEHRVVEQKH